MFPPLNITSLMSGPSICNGCRQQNLPDVAVAERKNEPLDMRISTELACDMSDAVPT
jgi:hypothetical protein